MINIIFKIAVLILNIKINYNIIIQYNIQINISKGTLNGN